EKTMDRVGFCMPVDLKQTRYFFFSSRRRHTRWPRDWSSDVCSSDLWAGWATSPPGTTPAASRRAARASPARSSRTTSAGRTGFRSEERRVGKECSSMELDGHEKKNKCEVSME